MFKYKELKEKDVSVSEKNMIKYWNAIDLLKLSVDRKAKKGNFVFYEGPPTANGKPGIHHVLARALKDSVCRYNTMQGYKVIRKAGWDTHGLPVEIEVEKKLNLSSKQEIERYGIGEFNKMCRESVFEYENIWREMTERMAYLVDMDDPYITLDNNYIESVWYILNKFFEENMIYEGHKILPFCTRCGTGLASHEVAQGYKEIKSQTVISKFKVADKDEYFLVWTTTPWTLPSNVALAVHPEHTYIKVKENDEVYYILKDLADNVLLSEYEILDEYKGKDLEGIKYEQLLPFITPEKEAFKVLCADFVTTEDGTGIVHIAPAFGEDDYNLCKRNNMPVIQPVGEDGKFTDTPWKGQSVMESDLDIVIYLGNQNKVYKKEKMFHNYPHCWRCDTPLLYYAKPSWYIEMTKIKDKLIESNNNVKWQPSFVGEKRFGNWLENLNDWAISRSRYWGTPLPLWRCECGNIASIGSKKDLVEKSIKKIDFNIDLHRPFVDDIKIKCDKCDGEMTRVTDVIDCWFDSGSMPFAQYHYPFENLEKFDELFPADFICEGIDQTRGWFYSLIAISTFMTGKSPYKSVLVNDLVLDKEGKKMSKSRGNTVNPFELFEKYGVDSIRWYLYFVSPPWTPLKFNEDGIKEVDSKFFTTLKNIYNFFTLYANNDKISASDFHIDREERPEIDRWIISKVNSLTKRITEYMKEYDVNKTVREIQEFVNEDFSNWYIRRSRRRFWQSELNDDKKAVYNTTYEVLVAVCKLAAPFAPFITDELFINLTGYRSVHLSDYPVVDEKLILKDVEEKMELVKRIVNLGRSLRESVKIKVRQPLNYMILDSKYKDIILDLTNLIKEELNIKEIRYAEDISEYMLISLKPNFKNAGPLFGKNINNFKNALLSLDANEISNKLERGELVTIEVGGKHYEIDESMVIVSIDEKEGYTVRKDGNVFVIIDTSLNQELIDEGYAREVISKVQQLRKQYDFDLMDNIKIIYSSTDELKKAVEIHKEFIMKETLAVDIEVDNNLNADEVKLNNQLTKIDVIKVYNEIKS